MNAKMSKQKSIKKTIIRLISLALIVASMLAIVVNITLSIFLFVTGVWLGVGLPLILEDEKKERKEDKPQKKKEGISLEEHLKRRIIGQDEAIKDIVNTIKFNTLKQEKEGIVRNTLGVFLLVGVTGTGKTETAKAVAEWFHHQYGHQFIRIDMGNLHDQHTASMLTGSPPGYIGSEEGGKLTRPLMANPNAVVLFDELEKGHHSLYRTLMTFLDEGRIQEISTGYYARISQGIIIFTSNLMQGTIRQITERVKDEVEREMIIRDVLTGNLERAKKIVDQDVLQKDFENAGGKFFPPEFIGRIDKIAVYKPLNTNHLGQLVVNKMAEYGLIKDEKDLRKYNDDIIDLAFDYKEIADKYGVRVWLKKIEEIILTKYL